MVTYGVKELLTDSKPMGLVDRIRSAKNYSEIEAILTEGQKYTMASPKTTRRWNAVAKRRLAELQKPAPAPKSAEKPPKKAR